MKTQKPLPSLTPDAVRRTSAVSRLTALGSKDLVLASAALLSAEGRIDADGTCTKPHQEYVASA